PASREEEKHERLFIAPFQHCQDGFCRFPAFRVWHWVSRGKILESRNRFLRKGRSRYYSFKPYKWRERKDQAVHHGMSRFSHRHNPYFPEILQVRDRLAAHDSRALPPQFSLHGRRDVDSGQSLVENLAGELFQIRHGRLARAFV